MPDDNARKITAIGRGSEPVVAVTNAMPLSSMPGRVTRPARLEQEPRPPLGLVNPDFDQARRGDVAVLIAQVVRFAEASGEFDAPPWRAA